MKKLTALLLVAMMALALLPMAVSAEQVTLTYGSWRSDDAEQVQALFAEYEKLTGVKILYQPTTSTQYNATLRLQLDNGTGPDLFDARSFATSRELYEAGFMMNVSDIPGIKENFTEGALDPWRAADGVQFAVPYAAVNHVVYYNKDIFAKYDLKVPETFEDFLAVCETLKTNGETVFANGIADNWDILECVFCGMLPNYIGGVENRVKYETGEARMDDEHFLAALKDFEALTKYFPEGFEAVKNADGPDMLMLERAAMFIDGSWTCRMFNEFPAFGVFAIPPRKGAEPGMCLHADMGIAGNAATKHPEEVKKYLEWIASKEGVQTAINYLTEGFLPIINAEIKLEKANVQQINALNAGRVCDSRFIWNKFMDMYSTPLVEQLNAIATGKSTPEDAARLFAEAQMKVLGK